MKFVCFEKDIRYAKNILTKNSSLCTPDKKILENFDKFIKQKKSRLTPSFYYYGKIFIRNQAYKQRLNQLLQVAANLCRDDIMKYKKYVLNIKG